MADSAPPDSHPRVVRAQDRADTPARGQLTQEVGQELTQEYELVVGAPAAGGSCVARLGDGRVVFVRHALPGERVRVRITDDRGSHLFADAVEVLGASPDRVPEPCPYARPGRCGGCDWQHATGPAQRAIKAQVIREQFRRIAHVAELLDGVEELPGGLLGWRTRNVYATTPDGRLGLRRHRSHDVEPVEFCLIGAPGVGDSPVLTERWPGVTGVEVVGDGDGDCGEASVLAHRPGRGRHPRGRRPPDRVELVSGPAEQRRRLAGRDFTVAAGGFWQVHPAAADTFAIALLDAIDPQPGEQVLDLYAGAGALTAVLAGAVGATGRVIGLEAAPQAVADAERNLAELPRAEVRRARVTPDTVTAAAEADDRVDLVVLDPPRAGAGRDVMTAILELAPRAVGYVACDPAALARDVRTAVDAGWRLASLRAFDAFPMTAHVECVAALLPPG